MRARLLAVSAGSLLLLAAAPALGQDVSVGAEGSLAAGRQPVSYAERPLTLPEMTLRIDGSFQILKLPDFFEPITMTVVESDPIVALVGGAGFGVMDDFEVGATVLPLLLAPEVEYGNPSLYAMYRFLRGQFEMAGRVDMTLPFRSGSDFILRLGVPMLFRAGTSVRVDTGAFLEFEFGDPDTVASLLLPAAINFNVIEAFYLGLLTGISIPDFDFDLLTIPLGMQAAYTIAGAQGPMVDLFFRFSWPAFLLPGSDGDTVVTEVYLVQAGANIFLYN